MITENSLANYGIDDPENKENIEMNIDTKDSKLKSKSNNSKMEISSQKIESISEKIQNLNINSKSISQSKDNTLIFTKENLNEKYNELESKRKNE